MIRAIGFVLAAFVCAGPGAAQMAAASREWTDPSPHTVRFVAVAPGVRLEVLDWGGNGEPLVFLAAVDYTAHTFDDFAPRFTDRFRVLAITRRGFGASSQPEDGYDLETLAQDIRAVLDSLRIPRAAFVGHSMGAMEMTRFARNWPERVSALVNFDTPMPFPDLAGVAGSVPPPPQMTETDHASIAAFQSWIARERGVRLPEAEIRAQQRIGPEGRVGERVTPLEIAQRIFEQLGPLPVEHVRTPLLAIANRFATIPYYDALDAEDRERVDEVLPAIAHAVNEAWDRYVRLSGAQIIDLPSAGHHVYISNAQEVFEGDVSVPARAAPYCRAVSRAGSRYTGVRGSQSLAHCGRDERHHSR